MQGSSWAGLESFATTNWSLVARAGDRSSPEGEDALAALCRIYWFPLFAFARRQGRDPAAAEDAAQSFMEALLEKNYLQDADPVRGRFRTFLLTAFRNHVANVDRHARAGKRGGGRPLLSLDFVRAEERYSRENGQAATPEEFFERQWAVTLLENVMTRLRTEQEHAGRKAVFDVLHAYLEGMNAAGYREAAETLGMTDGAVKTAVHRLRRRYAEMLREEIARTVVCPDDVEDEIRNLFTALGTN